MCKILLVLWFNTVLQLSCITFTYWKGVEIGTSDTFPEWCSLLSWRSHGLARYGWDGGEWRVRKGGQTCRRSAAVALDAQYPRRTGHFLAALGVPASALLPVCTTLVFVVGSVWVLFLYTLVKIKTISWHCQCPLGRGWNWFHSWH